MRTEPRDLSLKRILYWFGSFAAIIVVFALVIVIFYGRRLNEERHIEKQTLHLRKFPVPRLQSEPRQDLAALRAYENEILTTEGPGLTPDTKRVPIEKAMEEMSR